jgi:hypothetical protein
MAPTVPAKSPDLSKKKNIFLPVKSSFRETDTKLLCVVIFHHYKLKASVWQPFGKEQVAEKLQK